MIADNIKIVRTTAGLTQAQLAVKIGCMQKDISRWENGVREPSAGAIKKIADALGCSTDELLK